MMLISKEKNIKKDQKKIKKFSLMLEKKISNFDKDKKKIENLSYEELQDLSKLVHVADYILTKYEDKKQVYNLFKDFVEMINRSSSSIDFLNDNISELVISAESAISRIKNLQNDVSENYSLNGPISQAIKPPTQA